MAVTKNKVLVLRYWGSPDYREVVDAYDHEGAFVRQFYEEITWFTTDITADDDDRIMIVNGIRSCIHVFTDGGEQLSKFHINTEEYFSTTLRIGCHPSAVKNKAQAFVVYPYTLRILSLYVK